MIWGILLIILAIIVLPVLIMTGLLELLFNPVVGIVMMICITAIIIAKIIRR